MKTQLKHTLKLINTYCFHLGILLTTYNTDGTGKITYKHRNQQTNKMVEDPNKRRPEERYPPTFLVY